MISNVKYELKKSDFFKKFYMQNVTNEKREQKEDEEYGDTLEKPR